MTQVLAVGAHIDDIELAAFGTLARHIKSGDSVHMLILSRGGLSRLGTDVSLVDRMVESQRESADLLGASYRILDFPDQKFDTIALLEITQAIEAEIEKTQVEIVYTHHTDLNRDHAITNEATMVACRPTGTTVKELYTYETLSSSEWTVDTFEPNQFVDITSTLALKIQLCMLYCGEMRSYPHPRSPEAIEALATARGSQSGLYRAEAFRLIRGIK